MNIWLSSTGVCIFREIFISFRYRFSWSKWSKTFIQTRTGCISMLHECMFHQTNPLPLFLFHFPLFILYSSFPPRFNLLPPSFLSQFSLSFLFSSLASLSSRLPSFSSSNSLYLSCFPLSLPFPPPKFVVHSIPVYRGHYHWLSPSSVPRLAHIASSCPSRTFHSLPFPSTWPSLITFPPWPSHK